MRIVVRSSEPRLIREAQSRLAAAGYEAAAVPVDRAAPDGEDVTVVAVAAGQMAAAAAVAEKLTGEARPLAVLAGASEATPPAPGLERPAPFDGVVALDANPKLLAGQIAAAIRAGVAAEERKRRIATAVALGAAVPRPPEPRLLKALYIGAPSPQFLELERALAAHQGLVAAAFTSFSGFDHLHDEHFDAVVLNGARDPSTAISLCAALRRNAQLHHLPTLVVTAANDTATAAAAIDRGAAAVATANTASVQSLAWLFEAIRRERRRAAAEHDVRALRDIMGDPRIGLFRRAAFEAHVARMADDHQSAGRAMAMAALRVLPAHGASAPSEQQWRRGFSEIASLAGRLMRDTDSGAVIGRDLLALALPATDLAGARRTAERIASVGECTAFASGDDGQAPLIFEQSAVELQPGESGAGLLQRALAPFAVESATA